MGCAVKLMGVEGEKLLPGESNADSQDFLCLNQPSVPADDAQQLLIISTAPANPLTAPFKLLSALGLAHTLRVVTWGLGWALPRIVLRSAVTFDFYSITPISLGPHAVKFRWASRQDKRPLPTPGASWLNYLREELRARLAQGELRYDFQVQFYVDPIKTPIDGAALWSEADAPFVTLAELVVPPCDLDSEQSKADQRRLDGLGFNPWRALPEHRPLGNIQRARGMIYQGSQTYSGRDPDPTA
jgi:hypothetical protein